MPEGQPLDADAEYKSLIREVVVSSSDAAHALADVRPILAEYVAEKKRANDLEEKRQKQFGILLDNQSVKSLASAITASIATIVAAAGLYYASHWFGTPAMSPPVAPPAIEHTTPVQGSSP